MTELPEVSEGYEARVAACAYRDDHQKLSWCVHCGYCAMEWSHGNPFRYCACGWKEEQEPHARLFNLVRDADISGVSGTGVVAEGVEFSDGVVSLRWIVPAGQIGSGNPTSVVFHDNGIASVEKIHGHNGATRIVWLP